MHCPLPPSPSFSSPDSLAGIDDLDAFLAAQGDLSRFPTPPPPDYTPLWKEDGVVVTAVEILDEDADEHHHDALVQDEQFFPPPTPLEGQSLATSHPP
nr:hypothetical protein CFP56_16911 [Quercus suber]